ncbi:MAG TPA: threo-3-hydroxy-L-aspartate ammonia-lyase [Longimicrobiales bacterium]|nr:threo-3-hydroxy-L-aspartate ammonia-lyase [Longimicrobiales bacterium]
MRLAEDTLPGLEAVRAAARRLHGVAHRTPVMTSRTLDELTGAQVFLKCENFQRVGAFKFRGAYNALSQLGPEQRQRGVLTFSSGNHAQAIALAGRLLDIKTTIIMPGNAPAAKLEATRGYGAEIIVFDPSEQKREELAVEINAERNMIVIPPYDHADIVAGQGTAALELFEETGALDVLLVPCGGGGLLSGSAIAAKGVAAGCAVIGVEPEVADDATRSFKTGTLHTTHSAPTIADGLRTPALGKITFPLVRKYVDDMVTVSEAEIVDAMRFLWTRMKLVVEPSGAVPLAPVLRAQRPKGKRIGVILSGGNVDMATACSLLLA